MKYPNIVNVNETHQSFNNIDALYFLCILSQRQHAPQNVGDADTRNWFAVGIHTPQVMQLVSLSQ
jgi:hypothetical protein